MYYVVPKNKFSLKNTQQIIDQLPTRYLEAYENASKSEKMILIATFNEFLADVSKRKDRKEYLKRELNIDID